MKKLPKELDEILGKVLAYRPPPKSKAAKKRTEQAKKVVELKRAAD
ncbi:MAG: hypothetical protein ABR924_21000 [Terracidiphilus sp.]|jgi:hypothetical protein